jgi:deazaflavin-dependent oxidoreductase (nitroreductase family)
MFAKHPTRHWWTRWWFRWVVLLVIVLRVVNAMGFRAKHAPFINAVRAFNKQILNPAMLHLAGHSHWYAARVEHVGRRSGRTYATPVMAEPIPGGFVVPLPYGTDVDWCQNLLAAGGGVIQEEGVRYTVGEPEIVETKTLERELPAILRRLSHVYGITHFLRVKIVPKLGSVPAAAPTAAD